MFPKGRGICGPHCDGLSPGILSCIAARVVGCRVKGLLVEDPSHFSRRYFGLA